MWLSRLRTLVRGPRSPVRPAPKRHRWRPQLKQMEDRALPSIYTASTTAQLIADINAANKAGGSNTILLATNTTFDLTAVNNTTNGANGLPVIKKGGDLTIAGQGGDIIQRDTAAPAFRLFDVASGATLTLNNQTLQGGEAFGSGSAADGGAVYNQGSLILNGVTVQQNIARGQSGSQGTVQDGNPAAGGGIWSSGSLTLQGATIVQSNSARGGDAGTKLVKNSGGPLGYGTVGGNGGDASGGGIWSSGSLIVQGATLSANDAVGGSRGTTPYSDYVGSGIDGSGFGGGVYVAAGTATLAGTDISSNEILGTGAGGGIYISSGATVYLDTYTVTHTTGNTAALDPDIDGAYIPI